MILDEIKKANIQALKNKDSLSRSVFSVFLNKVKLLEIAKREKGEEISEPEIVAMLQKMLKELAEEKENYEKVSNLAFAEDAVKQIQILEAFLPKMMSEEDIYNIIEKMQDKSIGNVMKVFKTEFAGKCDMRLVGQVLKRF